MPPRLPRYSHRYFIDETNRLVYIKVSGKPPRKASVEFVRRVFGDPKYAPGFSILSDRRDVDSTASPEDLETAIRFLSSIPECRWALVVSRKAQMTRGKELEQRLGEARVTGRVFYTLGEALEWLGVRDAPEMWHRNVLG